MKKNGFMRFNLLKDKRMALGLSQKAVADKIGISQQHWDRYEKGYPIPLDKIISVSKVLNISKWDLLPVEFKPEESFDKKRLTTIIISIEKLIIEKKLHFLPEQKAKLILLLYEKFSKNPSNDNISQNISEIITDLITKKTA